MVPFAHGRGFCIEAFNVSEVGLRVEHALRLGWWGHKHWAGGLLERRLSQLAMYRVRGRSLITLAQQTQSQYTLKQTHK